MRPEGLLARPLVLLRPAAGAQAVQQVQGPGGRALPSGPSRTAGPGGCWSGPPPPRPRSAARSPTLASRPAGRSTGPSLQDPARLRPAAAFTPSEAGPPPVLGPRDPPGPQRVALDVAARVQHKP